MVSPGVHTVVVVSSSGAVGATRLTTGHATVPTGGTVTAVASTGDKSSAGWSTAGGMALQVFPDDLAAPAPGHANVRVIRTIPGATRVNAVPTSAVRSSNPPLVLGPVGYGQASPYLSIAAAMYQLKKAVVPPTPVTEKIFNDPAVDLSNASDPRAIAPPTRLVIPAIGVDTLIVPLGRAPDGSAQVPSGTTYTSLGPRPRQLGPAVIFGHIDSYTGPGVFFRLRSLLPGDDIMVQAGPRLLRFEVWKLAAYPKDHFATAQVFGPTPVPELCLITCGGPFDTSIGHYEDNVVVFAVLTG